MHREAVEAARWWADQFRKGQKTTNSTRYPNFPVPEMMADKRQPTEKTAASVSYRRYLFDAANHIIAEQGLPLKADTDEAGRYENHLCSLLNEKINSLLAEGKWSSNDGGVVLVVTTIGPYPDDILIQAAHLAGIQRLRLFWMARMRISKGSVRVSTEDPSEVEDVWVQEHSSEDQ